MNLKVIMNERNQSKQYMVYTALLIYNFIICKIIQTVVERDRELGCDLKVHKLTLRMMGMFIILIEIMVSQYIKVSTNESI